MFLDLRDRLTLVVGGGAVAARKVELLLGAGARVRVVAPELPIATTSGERSTIAGIRQEDASPSSTTLTNTPRARPSAATA